MAPVVRRRPPRLVRWILTWPQMVYRLHLGSIFGHRLLLLSHRGRKSGRTHRTILEVGQYDRLRGEAIVITPWPTRAEWYLNIQAAPASELAIAGRRYRPCQRFLAAPELARLLDITPPKGRRLEAVGLERLIGWRRDLDEPSRIVVLASLGGVAFGELRGGSTHPERYARLAFSPIGSRTAKCETKARRQPAFVTPTMRERSCGCGCQAGARGGTPASQSR